MADFPTLSPNVMGEINDVLFDMTGDELKSPGAIYQGVLEYIQLFGLTVEYDPLVYDQGFEIYPQIAVCEEHPVFFYYAFEIDPETGSTMTHAELVDRKELDDILSMTMVLTPVR